MGRTQIRSWLEHLPDRTFDYSSSLEQKTLVGAWKICLESKSSKPLFYHDDSWISRSEFLEKTNVIAGRLNSAGLITGDRVLISGKTSVDLAAAHVACLRLGLVVIPVNGAYQKLELEHVVRDAQPRAALVDHDNWADWISDIDKNILVKTTAVDLPDGPVPQLDDVTPDAPALIVYTSGTTGRPKGAVHTQASLLAGVHSVALAWRWIESDRLLLCLPLFHMHGLGLGLHGTLFVGGSAVLQTKFSSEAVLSELIKHDCSMFFGVPTMYHRLVESPGAEVLNSLRLCVSGSAPLSADLHQRLKNNIGVDVLERYGTTETLMLISNPYNGERRSGSVGIPLPGVEVILDEVSGEILVRGPSVFDGYWGNEQATIEALIDGWFHTGDLAEIDEDGYLSIVGRAKDLIITGGFNVYPREVEDVLIVHNDIAEIAVAGIQSEEWGEEVAAWVVPVQNSTCPTVSELRDFAMDLLTDYKIPRRVIGVSSLPRNSLGKVLRYELKETTAYE